MNNLQNKCMTLSSVICTRVHAIQQFNYILTNGRNKIKQNVYDHSL